MRRATFTIPDDLDAYLADQDAKPSLAAVTQSALRQVLKGRPAGDGLVESVLRLRSEIKAIPANHGATEIYLFGSVARGEARSSSDVDFAVDVVEGATLFDLARMRSDLIELLGTDVDVVARKGLEGSMRSRFDDEAIRV